MNIVLSNIDRLLKEKKTSDNAVSLGAKAPDAIRNLRRTAAGKAKGGWTVETLEAIAKELKVEPWELLRPNAAISSDEEKVRSIVRDELDQRMAPKLQKTGSKK